MRLQTVLIALVLASIAASSGALHVLWWRTARQNSMALAQQIETQIAGAVQRDLWARVVGAETAHATAKRLLAGEMPVASREQALSVALQSAPFLSSLLHVAPTGEAVAALLSDGSVRFVTTDVRLPPPAPTDTVNERWVLLPRDPIHGGMAVAYGGRDERGGGLAAIIELTQFSDLLGAIPVGQTGGAYVIGPDGRIIASPVAGGRPIRPGLDPVALAAGQRIAQRPAQAKDIVEAVRLEAGGEAHAVSLSPLSFQGWQFAVIIPEEEFLGEINRTTQRVAIGLLAVVLLAAWLAVLLARRMLVRPIRAVVGDVGLIERFAFDKVVARRSGVAEIEQLSAAIARMAAGLSDFGKYIPTDLVRSLVADGIRAEPGGETRPITVMFADVVGFTGLSERLGPRVVDVVSRYLDLASRTVEAERGIVDKFIGDAVMAIWGAPHADEAQALHACRSALALRDGIASAGIADDTGQPLKVRIGLHSGDAIVGNIGSPTRLNYTAIGDNVNLASRLEGVNKIYGTDILISEATRALAGEAVQVREIDRIMVYGRMGSVRVFELIGLTAAGERPAWADAYEAALAAYRARDFQGACTVLDRVLEAKPQDGPALRLRACCERLIAEPPPADWVAITALDSK